MPFEFARYNYRVEVLDSSTREAAPTQLRPWIGQRTRWMKGWMQTFIVHNRNPFRLLREMGPSAFVGFEVLVSGMILAPILHCGFALVMLGRWLSGTAALDGSAWSAFYVAVLALGYGSALLMVALGLRRSGQTGLLAGQVMLPLYWLLMGIATIRAAYELVKRPFYWFKSPHQPNASLRRGVVAAPLRKRRTARLRT